MDLERIRRIYRGMARFYDATDLPWRRLRARAVARLAVQPGAAVLDLGCGTGLSFALIERGIGPAGTLIGIDLTADMLDRARKKIDRHGWTNVTLMQANAEEMDLPPESVDALHCFYVHDVVMSRPAMERAVAALRPGGRCVIAGPKRGRGRLDRVIARLFAAAFVTSVTDAPRPWAIAAELIGPLTIEEHQWGSAYLAWGTKP